MQTATDETHIQKKELWVQTLLLLKYVCLWGVFQDASLFEHRALQLAREQQPDRATQ